jgi:isopentenyldiphosphate isomerase
MEEVILVDKNDAVLGYKLRSDLVMGDRWRICGAVVFDGQGNTMIAQRSKYKKHDPLKWGPGVAGTLEKGETYEECVARELEEELGITSMPIKRLYGGPIDASNGNKRYCEWFSVVVPVGFVPKLQDEEVADYAWANIEVLMKDIKTNPDKFLNSHKDWLRILQEFKG